MKKKVWTIGNRVALLSGVSVAFVIGMGVVGTITAAKLLESLRAVSAVSVPNIKQVTAIQALGLEYRGTSLLMGTPGLTADYKSKQLAHLKELRAEILGQLDRYGDSLPPEQAAAYQELKTTTTKFLATVDQFLALSIAGKSEQAGAFWSVAGGAQSKKFRKALEDAVAGNERLAQANLQRGVSSAHWANILCWALLATAAVLGSLLGRTVVRNIKRTLLAATLELRQAAQQVALASGQVLSSSQILAENATEEAAMLAETSASGEEVTAATRRNAEKCQRAATLMQDTDTVVASADGKLDGTLATMKEIKESSDRIATVTKIIDDIAFRTNILALNAAVEAARAGEAGMGFAVVADEVRSLAGRCAEAVKQIAGSVEESVEKVHAGQSRLDDVALSVRNMAASSLSVKELIQQIDNGARQQSSNFNKISGALRQIEQTTQRTATMAEESAAASAQLKAQADSLEEIIGVLEALV